MKAHRLSLREATMPSFELELLDGTVIHVLPCKPSQVAELQSFATTITSISSADKNKTEQYIQASYGFVAEVISENKERIRFTAESLREKYLTIPSDSPEDKTFNELMIITQVMSGYIEFLSDIKNSKN